jgi:hypothetical protein
VVVYPWVYGSSGYIWENISLCHYTSNLYTVIIDVTGLPLYVYGTPQQNSLHKYAIISNIIHNETALTTVQTSNCTGNIIMHRNIIMLLYILRKILGSNHLVWSHSTL